MSGSTSQPNLNSVCAALANTERDPGLDFDSLNEFSDYWEEVLGYYKPFDTAPRSGTAEVYDHEMPGGQYTNLREQANAMGLGHRWREIARTYAEVNQLFGDIVKVTPSSKVVGDMCMFLVTRGIKAADVPNLKPGSIDFPESVIDMLSGGLGQPDGGWPAEVQKVVLGNRKATTHRPGELAEPVDLEATRAELAAKTRPPRQRRRPLLPPDVSAGLRGLHRLPRQIRRPQRPADARVFLRPADRRGNRDRDRYRQDPHHQAHLHRRGGLAGRRALFYELNGMPRESIVMDNSLKSVTNASRPKGEPGNPAQACAPMPGMVTEVAVSPGQEVKAGDKLVVLEAMKMLTTVSASADGTVSESPREKGRPGGQR